MATAEGALDARGVFRVALSGGTTPELMYRQLARIFADRAVSLAAWQLFWSDERAVPPEHDASNYRMVRRVLIEPAFVPPENVHRMLGEIEPARAAKLYEQELGEEPLDLVLLGMGEDGHTASLFPGRFAIDAPLRVLATESPVPPPRRISLSLREINEARAVAFLVTGTSKAKTLARVLQELRSATPTLPSAMVRPRSQNHVFFVDDASSVYLVANDRN